jgi:serine protease Do
MEDVMKSGSVLPRKKPTILLCSVSSLLVLLLSVEARPQSVRESPVVDSLQRLNISLEELSARVAPSVVHIEVVAYESSDDKDDGSESRIFTKQRGSGSGVIIDPEGYIITAYHVIEGAKRIRVEVDSRAYRATSPDQDTGAETQSSMDARIVGTFKDADLGVLKIDARDFRYLTFSESDKLRQGELVVALGSPHGLRNSVSLGVVSSVARQIEPDDSMVYVQTDAALNSGSSGGPLVDVQGRMVGMNVFSLTKGGGSEGVGFAVPSETVRYLYEEIRNHGHVRRAYTGISVQGITSTLAAALHLPRDRGVIVSDVAASSPAESANLQSGDVLLSVEGSALRDVPQLALALLHKHPGDQVTLGVARKSENLTIEFSLVEPPSESDDLSAKVGEDVEKNLVAKLGIVGYEKGGRTQRVPSPLRPASGVLVAARLSEANMEERDLVIGDVIRSVNAVSITSVAQLRAMLDNFKPGDPIALQVERKGKLMYVAFEMD